MASTTELAALQAFIDRNPEIQSRVAQLAKDSQGRGIGARGRDLIHGAARDVRAALDKAGVTIPKDYVFDMGSGRIVKREGIPAWAFALPAIAFAPMAITALGAGAGAVGAGASALPGASAAPSLATVLGPAPTAAGAGGLSTSMLGRFGSSVAMKAIGAGLGAAADTAAQNRSTSASLFAEEEILNQRRREAHRAALEAREADRQRSGELAFREAQRAEYLANGGRAYTPKSGLPSYGFGPTAATPEEIAAATAYRAEQRRRLDAGDSLIPAPVDPGPFTMPERVTKPGTFERFAGIGAPIISILDALRKK